MNDGTCSLIEREKRCGKPVYSKARGWCKMHYRRWERHGDPLFVKQIQGDDRTRLLSYIQVGGPDECWPWTGTVGDNGYGYTRAMGKQMLAHRAAFALFADVPLPDDDTLDHLCHVHDQCEGGDGCPHRRCCNWVNHLSPATRVDNTMRGNGPPAKFARRDRCGNGHIYTEASSYIGRKGDRRCRICRRDHKRGKPRNRRIGQPGQAS